MIDINTYLAELAVNLKIDDLRKQKINSSYDNLEGMLFKEFRASLDTVTIFGSYDRGTAFSLLNDKNNFDVDVLLTFKKDQFKPQTYLNQIKSLGQQIYSRSGVSFSYPTVTIELNHVRFELVPAIKMGSGTDVKIPAPRSNEEKWIETNPEKFKKKLLEKDEYEKGMIIPLVKLIKYWNICNGANFDSYYLENFIVERSYSSCKNLKDYFFEFVSDVSRKGSTDVEKKVILELVERKRRLIVLEEEKIPEYIKQELNSFLPIIE